MIRFLVRLSCLAVLPLAGAQSTAPTQSSAAVDLLLARVPDDTAAFALAPSVQQVMADVAAFNLAIGVEAGQDKQGGIVFDWPDILKDAAGVDLGGPFALATSPDTGAPLLFCVLKDAETWKRSAHTEDLGGGLLRTKVGGEVGLAAIKDDVLILGDERDTVRAALESTGKFAERFRTHAGKFIGTHDLLLYADVQPWRPLIDAGLIAAGMSMRMGMVSGAQHDESALRMIRWGFDELGKLVAEAESCAAAVRIGSEGVSVEVIAAVRPEGPVGTYLKQIRKGKGGLLRGLSAGDYFGVLGCEWEVPPGTKSLTTAWCEALLDQQTLRQKLGPEAYDRGWKATAASYDLMAGFSGVLTAAPDAKNVLIYGLCFTRDPQALIQNTRTAYEISPAFMNPFGPGLTMEVRCRDERVGSADACVIETVFKTEDEQTRRMLEAMYGKSVDNYMAVHPDGVAVSAGSSEAARAQLGKMLGEPAGKLADDRRIAAAMKSLSPDPQICLLLDLPRLGGFVVGAMREAGMPIPPIKWTDQPIALIAAGAYLEPGRIRIELSLPAEPIKALIEGVRPHKKSGGE